MNYILHVLARNKFQISLLNVVIIFHIFHIHQCIVFKLGNIPENIFDVISIIKDFLIRKSYDNEAHSFKYTFIWISYENNVV